MNPNNENIRSYIEQNVVQVPIAGCWLWNGCVDSAGYPVTGSPRFQERKVHRLSWLCFVSPIPDGLHVLHKCDVPNCVNPHHLFLGTHATNMTDRKTKGRNKLFSGERHGQAKLSEQVAYEIKHSTSKAKDVAAQYNISQWAVFDIRAGRTWKHL